MRSTRQLFSALMSVLFFASVGCGDGDLDKDIVTNLPPGNAKGSAFSGKYQMTISTKTCTGTCTIKVGNFSWSLCKVGYKDNEEVDVEQVEGALTVTGDSSMYVAVNKGGVDQDGSFDVGGYQLQAQNIGVSQRITGKLSSAGKVTATTSAKGSGSYEGQNINCQATYDVTGNKLP